MGLTATRSRQGSGSEPRDSCQRRDKPYYHAINLHHTGRPIKRTAYTSIDKHKHLAISLLNEKNLTSLLEFIGDAVLKSIASQFTHNYLLTTHVSLHGEQLYLKCIARSCERSEQEIRRLSQITLRRSVSTRTFTSYPQILGCLLCSLPRGGPDKGLAWSPQKAPGADSGMGHITILPLPAKTD